MDPANEVPAGETGWKLPEGCCEECQGHEPEGRCKLVACGLDVDRKWISIGGEGWPRQLLADEQVGDVQKLRQLPTDAGEQAFVSPVNPLPVPPVALDDIPFTAKAGTTLGTGTLGCALRSQRGGVYFLTAGHVVQLFERDGPVPRRHGKRLGTVKDWSTIQERRLDWGLVKPRPKITASNCINWEPGLKLSGIIPCGDLWKLLGEDIVLSGAASRKPSCAKVYLVHACIFVESQSGERCYRVQNQIIVRDKSLGFAQDGDSGAVAYLPHDNNTGYPAGTAVGLFWIKNLSQQLYALTPMSDVLKAASSPKRPGLELLP